MFLVASTVQGEVSIDKLVSKIDGGVVINRSFSPVFTHKLYR